MENDSRSFWTILHGKNKDFIDIAGDGGQGTETKLAHFEEVSLSECTALEGLPTRQRGCSGFLLYRRQRRDFRGRLGRTSEAKGGKTNLWRFREVKAEARARVVLGFWNERLGWGEERKGDRRTMWGFQWEAQLGREEEERWGFVNREMKRS